MERAAALRKKRTFRKFLFRGVELEKLLDLNHEEFAQLIHARARRRIYRGLKAKPKRFVARLRRAKKACGPMDKPEPVKTHLRDMVVVPEMIGSVVGVYNGKVFNGIEVKPEMVGHYLGEFSITYKPVRHGRPGIDELLALYPPEVRAKPYKVIYGKPRSPCPRRPPRGVFSLVLSPPFGPDASHAHQGGSRAHPCHVPKGSWLVGSW